MPQDPPASSRYSLPTLVDRKALGKLGIIGIVVAVVMIGFAWAGGWIWSDRLSQAAVIDRFQQVNGGVHSGFRRNHAKGVCVTGIFESNGAGARLSRAAVFKAGRVPVMGRFSLAGGHPHVADGPSEVRALGLRFETPNGEEWRTAMIPLPVFPVSTPAGFYAQLLATQPDPATGQPNPAKIAAFVAAHPEFPEAIKLIKSAQASSGFANTTFNSLNAFRFVDAAGAATPVRWSVVATEPFVAQAPEQAKSTDKNYLFDDLIARIARGPLQWRLVVTVGQPGDPTNDATKPWPADREHIAVGTITLDRAETEAPGNCRDINFDPLALPAGIEPSDDPLLSVRSAGYSESFTRREGEKKTPSAVQVPVAGNGS